MLRPPEYAGLWIAGGLVRRECGSCLGGLEAAIVKRIAFLHTVAALAEKFRSLTSAELPQYKRLPHAGRKPAAVDLMRQQPVEGITRRLVSVRRPRSGGGCGAGRVHLFVDIPLVDVPAAPSEFRSSKLMIRWPSALFLPASGSVYCARPAARLPQVPDLIAEHAARSGGLSPSEAVLVDNAFAALQRGDRTVHDELVQAAAADIALRTDVIVLAQASMAHLAEPRVSPFGACSFQSTHSDGSIARPPASGLRKEGRFSTPREPRGEGRQRHATCLCEMQHPLRRVRR